MTQNPCNAVIHLGHFNGKYTVTNKYNKVEENTSKYSCNRSEPKWDEGWNYSIPKSDQHLISPNSIIPGSGIANMRIM